MHVDPSHHHNSTNPFSWRPVLVVFNKPHDFETREHFEMLQVPAVIFDSAVPVRLRVWPTSFRPHATCLQVVAAPNAEIPQVQAAQDFKELSDKVANTRGESRGKRSAKGQAAAVAASRGGRVGGGGRSKSPPPPALRGGGRSRNSAALPVGSNGGRQRRRRSRSSSSGDSSSQQRRVSRNGSRKSVSGSNNTTANKRLVRREVVKSTKEAGEGNANEADDSSDTSRALPSKESVPAVEVDTVQPEQQEESTTPREGTTPEESEMPDAAVGPFVLGDGQQVYVATKSKEVLNMYGTPDINAKNASEESPAAEINHQQEISEMEASGIEGVLPTSTAAATEVKTPLASPPLGEDTTRTTLYQDEEGNDPDASSSSTIHDGEEVDTLDVMEEEDGGQDGRLGPETEGAEQPDSTAVIEFVPTERTLAAYCQVCTAGHHILPCAHSHLLTSTR